MLESEIAGDFGAGSDAAARDEAAARGDEAAAGASGAVEADGLDDAVEPHPDSDALESEVREALRLVVDPEIRIDVVTLGLIRGVSVGRDVTEVRMILTTPFCPYGGVLVQQVKDVTRSVVGGEVRVRMLDEMWSPDMIEGADLAEWGLI